jgi:hypothetical protein
MLVVILIIALFFPACAGERADPPSASTPASIQFHRKGAGSPREDGFYEARSTGGGFSVLLPGPFNDFSQIGASRDGGKITLHAVGMVTPVGAQYTATAMTSADGKALPKSNLEEMAATAKREGTLQSKRTVIFEGHSGIELYLKEPKTSAKMRGFDIEGTRYWLIAEFPSSAEKVVLEDVDKFLSSFKLNK